MAAHLRNASAVAVRFSAYSSIPTRPSRQFRLPLARFMSSTVRQRSGSLQLSNHRLYSQLQVDFASGRSYSSSSTTPLTESSPPVTSQSDTQSDPKRVEVPSYDLTFTCKPCKTRSTHRISKQGYHHGTVLITCPSCSNRHLIADHLNIFGDRAMTIDKFLEEHGEVVRRGTLGPDGDIEVWNDKSDAKITNKKLDRALQPEGPSSKEESSSG